MRRRRPPVGKSAVLKLFLQRDVKERLEEYCMRQSTRPPFKELKPSTVLRRAFFWYFEKLIAQEALCTDRRQRPACVYASLPAGLRWCPEHDARWEEGDEVPETCRGDG